MCITIHVRIKWLVKYIMHYYVNSTLSIIVVSKVQAEFSIFHKNFQNLCFQLQIGHMHTFYNDNDGKRTWSDRLETVNFISTQKHIITVYMRL